MIRKIFSFKLAVILSLFLFGLFILFHLSIIIGIVIFNYVPLDLIWGSRLESKEQLLGLEILSLGIMTICLFTVLIKSKRIKSAVLTRVANVLIWVWFAFFVFNTATNLLAESAFEKYFSIASFLLAVLCLRLALEKRKASTG